MAYECGEPLYYKLQLIMNYPKLEMTYDVTPCNSDVKSNIQPAEIKF